MKLSEAILLGDSLKKCNPMQWVTEDGQCGCALGGALLATGARVEEILSQLRKLGDRLFISPRGHIYEIDLIRKQWPWLTAGICTTISNMYWEVHLGTKTIYDIVKYVASIEPQEEVAKEPNWADAHINAHVSEISVK